MKKKLKIKINIRMHVKRNFLKVKADEILQDS